MSTVSPNMTKAESIPDLADLNSFIYRNGVSLDELASLPKSVCMFVDVQHFDEDGQPLDPEEFGSRKYVRVKRTRGEYVNVRSEVARMFRALEASVAAPKSKAEGWKEIRPMRTCLLWTAAAVIASFVGAYFYYKGIL